MKVMALQEIAKSLHKSNFCTIMIDETTDASNREQVVVCIQWQAKNSKYMKTSLVDAIDDTTITSDI